MERPATKAELHAAVGLLKDDLIKLEGRIANELTRYATKADLLEVEGRLESKMDEGFAELNRLVKEVGAQVGKLDRRQVISEWRLEQLEKKAS